jgi:hypothetical protein
MNEKNEIIIKIDDIVGELSHPLSLQEADEGWTEKSKTAIGVFFKELRSNILSGGPLPPLSIARGLDHWGVVNGELLEKAAVISNQLRNMKEKNSN